MGLDCAAAKFLCAAKNAGVDFSDTLMIGRQMYVVDEPCLQQIASALGKSREALSPPAHGEWAEWFFRLLGAHEPKSLDGSGHEGATYVQDLNAPADPARARQFSAVFDGGTLEHVFNVPNALKVCLEMVRLNGHYLILTVANNFMGHGFWQFSPDFFFRVLSSENGYELITVLLHEVVPNGPWYAVRDPNELFRRVELINKTPTYIMALAKRMSYQPILAHAPLQSDYSAVWADKNAGWRGAPWGQWADSAYSFQADSFHRLSDTDLLAGRLTWPSGHWGRFRWRL
jgi:hypothetical protein